MLLQNAMISNSLELATMKQKEADERVSKLIEEQKVCINSMFGIAHSFVILVTENKMNRERKIIPTKGY